MYFQENNIRVNTVTVYLQMLSSPIAFPSNGRFQGSQPTKSPAFVLPEGGARSPNWGYEWCAESISFKHLIRALLCARSRLLSSLPVKHRWSLLNSALGPSLGPRSAGNRRPIARSGRVEQRFWALLHVCLFFKEGEEKQERRSAFWANAELETSFEEVEQNLL